MGLQINYLSFLPAVPGLAGILLYELHHIVLSVRLQSLAGVTSALNMKSMTFLAENYSANNENIDKAVTKH